MTFTELGADWSTRPIWENDLADVVDLALAVRDRARNSLLLWWVADDGRVAGPPVVITDVDWREVPRPGDSLDHFLAGCARPGLRLLVGFGHPQRGVTLLDLRWRAALVSLLAAVEVEPVGFFSADLRRVTRVPDAAAFVA